MHDKQRVQSIPERLDALVRRPHLAFSLKRKGHCHHTDGEHAELLHELRYDRRRACPDAAAHTRRDEHEIGIPKRHFQPRKIALRRPLADLGHAAGTASARQTFPDLQYFYSRFLQNRKLLRVRIHRNQFNAGNLVLGQS